MTNFQPLGNVADPEWVRPRVEWVPPTDGLTSAGEEAVELALMAGLQLDAWQQWTLRQMLWERRDGRWLTNQFGLVVSRQNGKGAILEARELAGLFLLGDRELTHSAHLFDTSRKHMQRMEELIEGVPEFDRRVASWFKSKGQESLVLKGGATLNFKTRTRSGGRGLSGDLVVIDEAMIVPEEAMAALMPTLAARRNPQVVFTGSAVDQTVHDYGVAFARIRARAKAAIDNGARGAERLGWLEWSLDPDVYNRRPTVVANDPSYWHFGNPSMPHRVSQDWLEAMRRLLGDRSFATEALGVGDWPEVDEAGGDRVIPRGVWDELMRPHATIEGTFALAIDVTPERDRGSIAACGFRPGDGAGRHVEITGDATEIDSQRGTRWIVPRVKAIVEAGQPCAVIVDGASPAASLITDLEEAGIVRPRGSAPPDEDHLLVVADTRMMTDACANIYDAAVHPGGDPPLSHLGQQVLNRGLAAAKKRQLGDRWAWARKATGDISPVVAITLAHEGHRLFADVTDLDPVIIVQ